MAIPVARVHLKVAHAALPALLPTPPKWKMLPLLPPPPPCVTPILQSNLLSTNPSRADSDERWDAHKAKAKPAFPASHGSPPRKNATSPPPKPGRADSVERWDAHKKAAIPASSSSSSSGASSLANNSKWPINRATSAERWDVHKTKRCSPQADLLLLDDDGENGSNGNNDMNMEEEEEEEILWKPRAMYSGPGFVFATPESSKLTMRTAFLVPVA